MSYKYYLSLDISTTNVGIALWDEEGVLMELKHLALKVKRDVEPEYRDLIKGELFEEYFIKYKKRIEKEYNGEIKKIIVEAPLPNTKVNINTTALLLGFNGEARWILYKIFGVLPKKITVHESRKIFLPEFIKLVKKKGVMEEVLSFPKGWKSDEKKHYIWEKVCRLEENIHWDMKNTGMPKDYCYDISSFKNHTIKTDDEIYFKVICASSNLNIHNTPIIDLNFDDDINQIEIEDECLFHKNCGMKNCMEYILGAVKPKICLNNNKEYIIVKRIMK